ncbi:MAG: hypothetical protein CMG71_06070 [Candidatus Marinimicrobia bacterium]|nr:hypothetical protein [Candidatus Neomarinimicrobiota bacterium]|tara:strand:+ start:1378 stop:2391 length:1014 start_codon:yes stop_codon:yes gene_type:complete
MKRKNVFVTILAGLVFAGCDYKPRAGGVENQLHVVASFEDLPHIKAVIDSVFGRAVYTPAPETYFDITYIDPYAFDEVKRSHNLLVVSVQGIQDSTADRIARSVLPPDQLDQATGGANQVFSTKDFFARGQVFSLVVGQRPIDLINGLREKGSWLFRQYDKAFIKRQTEHVFKRREQKDLAEELWEKYQWRLRIQHDYLIIREQRDRNFVWIGRAFPYRWFAVNWIDAPRSKKIDHLIATEMVNDFPMAYYSKIKFTDSYQRTEPVELSGWDAWRVEGLWEHTEDIKGGPFISYVFYDQVTDRLFHINLLVYSPGQKKILSLRQMEIMAHTFATDSG